MSVDIGRELQALKARMDRMERSPRLSHAALDNTSIVIKDDVGVVRGHIGMQSDGTIGLIAVDGPAPGAPTAPVLTPSIGGLRVVWDGALADASVLPADFDHVAVHMSTSTGFTPSAATFVGTITRSGDGGMLPVTPLPYAAHYAVLIAVNTSGIPGPPSVEATATPLQVTGPDLTAGSVTAAAIQAGAVTADKLEAILQLATRLVAGNPTGARMEVDEDALRVYNGANSLTIKFDFVADTAVFTGSITGSIVTGGLIQTATSGERVTINEAGQNKVIVYDATGAAVGELSGRGILLEGTSGAIVYIDPDYMYPRIGLTNAAASATAVIQVIEPVTGDANLEMFSGRFTGSTFSDMVWRQYLGRDLAVIERLRSTTPSTVIGGRLAMLATEGSIGFKNTATPAEDTSLAVAANLATLSGGRFYVIAPASANSALYVEAATAHTGNLIRAFRDGIDRFKVDKDGNATVSGNLTVGGIGHRETKYRTTDDSRTSTVTATADTQITFPSLVANGVYQLDGYLKYSGAFDFLMGWTFPTGTLGEWQALGNGATVASATAAGGTQQDVASTMGYTLRSESVDIAATRTFGGIGTTVFGVQVRALIRVSSTAGTFALRWAQGTSNATSTFLYTDSHLRLERVG